MKRADVTIALPCHEDWDTMSLEGRNRFCGSCQKQVHDLSRMSEVEARLVVAKSATAPVCVRYLADRHGDVLLGMLPSGFVPVANLRASKSKRAALQVGALALSVATLAACTAATGAAPAPVVPDQTMMMGEIAVDPSAQPAPSSTAPAPSASSAVAPAAK